MTTTDGGNLLPEPTSAQRGKGLPPNCRAAISTPTSFAFHRLIPKLIYHPVWARYLQTRCPASPPHQPPTCLRASCLTWTGRLSIPQTQLRSIGTSEVRQAPYSGSAIAADSPSPSDSESRSVLTRLSSCKPHTADEPSTCSSSWIRRRPTGNVRSLLPLQSMMHSNTVATEHAAKG